MKRCIIILTAILFLVQASAFEFCKDGTQGEDNLRIISVDDMLEENIKEWAWQTSQKVEIEVRVENRENKNRDYVIEAIFKKGEKTIRIADDSDDLEKEFSLSSNERKSVSLKFTVDEDADTEDYQLYIKLYKKGDENEECVENSEETIKIEKIEICEYDKADENDLELTKIKDEKDDNKNEWEWTPGDNIEISLDLENKDYPETKFAIELIFLDENNEEISLADDSDEIYEELNLEEDEKDDVFFQFKLKSDIKEGKYTLYAKAYDTDDEDICTSLKAEDKSSPKTIHVKKDDRNVVVSSVKGPTQIEKSSQGKYSAIVQNLGKKDEDKVSVMLYNKNLGVKEKIEINNLESGESKNITFNIKIPKNISLKKYTLEFLAEYEYNERKKYYKSVSDEDENAKYDIITIENKKQQTLKEKNNTTVKKTGEENKTTVKKTGEENKTTVNETSNSTTAITGNAIGVPSSSSNKIILAILAVITIIGITLFFRKPKKKKIKPEAPQVIRRYSAKLN